ncbi:MAG: endo-1,3-1,4-beta-glycanase ExsH, partial [Crocosphaera sp.]
MALTNSVLDGNTSQKSGGGLYLGGETLIENSTIQNNRTTASYSDGGGIHIEKELVGSVTINDSVITNNQAVDHGGGIHNERELVLRNTHILNNQAEDGGGVFFDRGTIMVINGNIDGNRAINGNGGGFYNRQTINIANSSITNNHAITNGKAKTGRGGGIYSSSGAVYLVSSTIAGNTADDDGGGMFLTWFSSRDAMLNSTVIRNRADADVDG